MCVCERVCVLACRCVCAMCIPLHVHVHALVHIRNDVSVHFFGRECVGVCVVFVLFIYVCV